ncbi:MAG: homocysteine S-methyltransferase family protein [Fimbriimonadaceae bacterium]
MCECFPEIVAIGMNCATYPAEMTEHIRFLSENSTRAISIQPNAGLPMMEKGCRLQAHPE